MGSGPRVAVYPADKWGCGSTRMAWPGAQAALDGADVTVFEPGSEAGKITIKVIGGEAVGVLPLPFDAIVLQRPSVRLLAQAIPFIRANGTAVVVDVDDDMTCIHPRNASWAGLHPRANPDANWQWVQRACREATLTTVSTPALMERYGRLGRVRLLRNCVPGRYLEARRPTNAVPVTGWCGSVSVHPDDLQVCGDAVARAVPRFRAVGPPEGVAAALRLAQEPETTGPVDLEDWPDRVAELDVAIVPLSDTKFNAAKSDLKGLEAAACGVPFVASPRPEYERLAKSGAGVIASRPRDWERQLRSLVADGARRAELSESGREAARERTIEGNAWRWAEVWTEAAALEKEKVPA